MALTVTVVPNNLEITVLHISGIGPPGQAVSLTGSGAPSVSAVDGSTYVDVLNARLYFRANGVWVIVPAAL